MQQSINAQSTSVIAQATKVATRSKTNSLAFMKRITSTTFQQILYGRINFEKDDFKDLRYNTKAFKMLKNKVSSPVLKRFKRMLSSTMKSVEKDMVQNINMVLSNRETPNDPLEIYTMNFLGKDRFGKLDRKTQETLKNELDKSTRDLFDAVYKLDDGYEILNRDKIVIRLVITFVDGKTKEHLPRNLNTFFDEEDDEVGYATLRKAKKKFTNNYNMGELDTGSHLITLGAKGSVYDFNNSTKENQSAEKENITVPPSKIKKNVNCPCKLDTTFNKVDMPFCLNCNTHQHTACVGFWKEKDIGKPYICWNCNKNVISSELAWIRLALVLMFENKAYPRKLLRKLPLVNQVKLNTWLRDKGFIKKAKRGYKVNTAKLTEAVLKKCLN